MEEKVLIRSQKKKKSILFWITPGLIILIVGLILMELATQVFSKSHAYDFMWEFSGNLSVICYIIGTAVVLIGLIYFFVWSKCELTITTRRVFGVAAFGKRVDLPIDAISAVGTSMFDGIAITTSSGAIKFALIANRDEIHNIVSNLLIDRQNKSIIETPTNKQEISQSNADELKKYKELMDIGAITQEEFEAKKKQLLGL